MIEKYIAKRYLFSKHSLNFITIISILSVIGITIGVAALIVILSVYNGFNSTVTSMLVSIDPHLKINLTNKSYQYSYDSIRTAVYSLDNVNAFSAYVDGKAMLFKNRNTLILNIKGTESKTVDTLYNLRDNIIYGKSALNNLENELPKLILGYRAANHLGLNIGDTITLISPNNIEDALTGLSMPSMQQFILGGLFASNNNDYDASLGFININEAKLLFSNEERVQGYEIKLDNIRNAESAKKLLSKKLSSNYFEISSWYDFHKELYNVMQMERWAAYIILSLIIAVAVFNILASLTMSVLEKKRDIGILHVLGLSNNSISKIFLYQGIFTGILGTVMGSALGYLICFLQINYNIYPLDPTKFKIDALPIQLHMLDFFLVAGMAMLLSMIAAIYPAKRAAKINLIESIKWE